MTYGADGLQEILLCKDTRQAPKAILLGKKCDL